MRIYCRTNNDRDQHISWPTRLPTRPLEGEHILSVCGMHTRKIVQITHAWTKTDEPYHEDKAYLILELGK
jgi:hypothetical protein